MATQEGTPLMDRSVKSCQTRTSLFTVHHCDVQIISTLSGAVLRFLALKSGSSHSACLHDVNKHWNIDCLTKLGNFEYF